MCQFISWKCFGGKNYFLTNEDLDTKEGKKLLKPDVVDDLCGHGAIEHYYPELKGKGENKECTDFSTPDKFPKDIVKAIKQGKLSRIGICLDVLNALGKTEYNKIKQPAWAEYNKIEQLAWAEYNKIEQPALAEYNKIEQSAWAEYNKINQPAWAEYNKIQQSALAEYNKIEQLALAEYNKIEQPALAEYNKIQQPAWAEYEKIKQLALAEYEKIKQPAYAEYNKIEQNIFNKIVKQKKYRNYNWK